MNMDVGSVNTQVYSPMPEPRPVEEHTESAAPVEKPASASASALAKAKEEPEKASGENEEKGFIAEDLDDRQIEDMLSKGIKEANKKLAMTSNELHYSYHKPTRTVCVKVIDSETKELVREIPPQKELDALAKMWELAGILVDEKK